MPSSLDERIEQLEKSISHLQSLEPDFKQTAGMIKGNDRIKDAKWLNRDELIEQEQQRLEYYREMQRSLSQD